MSGTAVGNLSSGGSGRHHQTERASHYTVPFYVWSPGVPRADLYELNDGLRADPGTDNVGSDADVQPIRNGDAANLALALLGLPAVPGSGQSGLEVVR